MLIKITGTFYMTVEDEATAETLCSTLDEGLVHNFPAVPGGQLEGFDVDHWAKVSDEEKRELGLEDE